MYSTRRRTLVKAILWEIISFVLATGISYPFVGTLVNSVALCTLLFVVKVIFLYLYERQWKRIKWGKTTTP
jgi:uncharacterized membrane protein